MTVRAERHPHPLPVHPALRRAHASISCAAKSVAVASNQCDGGAQLGGRSAPAANVTFVFER